jgi:hypothetical protein
MVKQVRDEIKDRKEQWTWAELQKMPPKDMAAPKASPPPGQPKPSGPQEQSAPPSPAPAQPSTKG